MNKKQEIMKIIFMLGEYYSKQLNDSQLKMYAEDLDHYELHDIISAVKKYRMDSKNEFFPLPAKLIALIKPEMNEKDIALDAVHRIISAVSKFGYTNSKEAKIFIGSLGWETVQRFGGWQNLCQGLTSENEGITRAQLRELAQVVYKKSSRDELDKIPELPEPANKNISLLISNSMKAFK